MSELKVLSDKQFEELLDTLPVPYETVRRLLAHYFQLQSESKPLEIKVKLLTATAKIPTKSHPSDIGWDFYSDSEQTFIAPNTCVTLSLGVALALPTGYGLILKGRSGLGAKGVDIFAGVIDQNYRGELKCVVFNSSGVVLTVSKGDKIVQGILVRSEYSIVNSVQELDSTDRGEKGFGSSDDNAIRTKAVPEGS